MHDQCMDVSLYVKLVNKQDLMALADNTLPILDPLLAQAMHTMDNTM